MPTPQTSSSPPKIIGLTGASGFIGREFQKAAEAAGHRVIGYSRTPRDGQRALASMDFSGLDAVVHLAGESVLGLWTASKKKRILDSRVETTSAIAKAILASPTLPECFVMASGINVYGDQGDTMLTEDSATGTGFLAGVVRQWEAATAPLQAATRLTILRLPLVLGNKGAYPVMKRIFKLGLGGRLGSGNQWWPWVSVHDAVGMLLHAVENPHVSGLVNAVAPGVATNAEFTKKLAASLHRPAILPTPAFALKLIPGGMSEMFLSSAHVKTKRALELGYQFQHPELDGLFQQLAR